MEDTETAANTWDDWFHNIWNIPWQYNRKLSIVNTTNIFPIYSRIPTLTKPCQRQEGSYNFPLINSYRFKNEGQFIMRTDIHNLTKKAKINGYHLYVSIAIQFFQPPSPFFNPPTGRHYLALNLK